MINSFSARKRRFIIGIICLITFYSCKSIHPEPPSLPEEKIPIVEQPTSQIALPVTIDLKKYFKQVETSVSNQHSDSVQECQGLRYAYLLKRSPFTIKGSGNKINLSFQGEYWIKLSYCAKCKNDVCKVPTIGGACGIDEPMRKINIGYSSSFTLLSNYHLKSSTSLVTLEPKNKCKVTKLDIDATDKLIGYVKRPLGKVGNKMDARIADIDLKPRIEDAWQRISKEMKLGDLGYLSINPSKLSYDNINMNGSVFKTNLGVTVKPLLTTESHALPITPLPNLTEDSPGKGFEVYFDLLVSYDSLAHYLNRLVVGQTFSFKKHSFEVTNTKIYGIGNQKVVLAVDFKGERKGTIYFTATPKYDSKTNVLIFPDLQFDSNTMDLLIQLNEWMYNDEITNWLRQKAKFNLSSLVNKGKEKFQNGINRKLGKDDYLIGEVNSLSIEAVYPTSSKLILRAFAQGELEVKIQL